MRTTDWILSVDGVPAKRLSLDEVRGRLVGDGKAVRLTVRRGGETMRVILRLRRLI
jgi:C-terminal processing protease CtpA/Prc